jgi:WD40 repeat protein
LKVWDLTKKDWLFTLHTSFTGAVNRLAFSPDGQTLASGHYDGTIRVWDMQAGGLLFTIQTDEVIESLVFSPDGQMLASGGSYANSFVRLWDAHNGALLNTLEGNTSGVGYLLFSPDSRYLVSGSYDGMLRLWGVRP